METTLVPTSCRRPLVRPSRSLGWQGWREPLRRQSQPAHSTALQVLFGTWRGVRPCRPHEDRLRHGRRRHQLIRAARIGLWRCGKLPRWVCCDGPYHLLERISVADPNCATSQPYKACSSELKEGLVVSTDWTCTPLNVVRTCGSFDPCLRRWCRV